MHEESLLMESGSSLGTFLDCPKKYEFAYIKRLSSKNYSRSLGFGTFVHSLIEDYWTRQKKSCSDQGGDTEITTPAHTTLLDRELSRYDSQQHEAIKRDAALARDAVSAWEKMWHGTTSSLHNGKLATRSIEKEWSLKAGSRAYVGKSDAIVLNVEYGGHFLYELKTSGTTNREAYKHNLEINRQIDGNLLAMIDDGLKPLGVIYDIVWKPPLRLKKDETEDQLFQRIAEEYKNFPFKYFERIMVFRSEKDLDDFELDLSAQFRSLRHTYEGKRFFRNTNSCEKFGKLCPYFEVCLDSKGRDTEELESALFVKRDKKLPEISDEFQEKLQQLEE